MNLLGAIRSRFRRWPRPDDPVGVRRMVTDQWRTIAQRTPTYLLGYRDRPGSADRAQLRSGWIADQIDRLGDFESLLELGCGCGRNLAAVRRRMLSPLVPRLAGIDICPEALLAAQSAMPSADLHCADTLSLRAIPEADVVLTCGFLGHVPPADLAPLLYAMLNAARRRVVMVEEPGHDEVAKGPRAWGAEKNTGAYVLWRHDFDRVLAALGHEAAHEPLPEALRAPAATEVLVVETTPLGVGAA